MKFIGLIYTLIFGCVEFGFEFLLLVYLTLFVILLTFVVLFRFSFSSFAIKKYIKNRFKFNK